MKLKTLLFGVLFLVFAAVLTACGGSESTKGSDTNGGTGGNEKVSEEILH